MLRQTLRTGRCRARRGLAPGGAVLALSGFLGLACLAYGAIAATPDDGLADSAPGGSIKQRHTGVQRSRATSWPRSEGDQAVVDGWPLYRTERGQTAFNDTMATLAATASPAPAAAAFKGCSSLDCNLALPAFGAEGWFPAGRLWVSPGEYVLFVHSPRQRLGQMYRRHQAQRMRYFVYHEFHNSSRNTDTYDTISSHSSSVFVPFYMSKEATDAEGRRFVVIVQVAPYDVVSAHATNFGSAGPGIEVAKNVSDTLEPLQAKAGVLIGTMIKTAAPHLRVVNHRGTEGAPMLKAYEQRLAGLRAGTGAAVKLPFVAAETQRLQSVSARLDDLILKRGASPRIPVAERALVRKASLSPAGGAEMPRLVSGPTLVRGRSEDEIPVLREPPRRASEPECSYAQATACFERVGRHR